MKSNKRIPIWPYFLSILLTTPAALYLALVSGGAGHGTYFWAKAFFPFTMLGAFLFGDEITLPLMALAIVQIPLYGVLVYILATKGKQRNYIFGLAAIHLIAVILCFIFLNN